MFYLTTIIDRYGYTNTLSYNSTNETFIRLLGVNDADGRSTSIYYDDTVNTNCITRVVDPFLRTAYLKYDPDGLLTNITDVAGLSSSISYDTNGWPTDLVTPYGTNKFQIEDLTSTLQIDRNIIVTEPTGSRQIYSFIQYCSVDTNNNPWMPSTYPSGDIPNVPGNTFENQPDQRNSFYWNRRQSVGLPSLAANFSTNDYFKARMRHWLGSGGSFTHEIAVDTLSIERTASPNGTTEGQKTWYDYPDKPVNEQKGSSALAKTIARRTSAGTWYRTFARNGVGWPTRIEVVPLQTE